MKAFYMVLFFSVISTNSHAWPVIDEAIKTGSNAIKVYKDSINSSIYWYIPTSIEPWSKNNKYKSQLVYNTGKNLTFVFRGQASVDNEILVSVAKTIGIPVSNLAPISYDTSSNLMCENVYDPSLLKWIFPNKIGNYLEVVPVTIRTSDPDLADEVEQFVTGNGLACTVDVTFKAVSTGYALTVRADLNEVYSKFELAAHAEGWWYEADIHQVVQSLILKGIIKIDKMEDSDFSTTPLDTQVTKAFTEIVDSITKVIFTRSSKIPDGHLENRGRPFSLRTDYRRSEENKNFQASLNAKRVQSKESQIGLRIAIQ